MRIYGTFFQRSKGISVRAKDCFSPSLLYRSRSSLHGIDLAGASWAGGRMRLADGPESPFAVPRIWLERFVPLAYGNRLSGRFKDLQFRPGALNHQFGSNLGPPRIIESENVR